MIPYFPEFKKLELSDRVLIGKLAAEYEPYSDFNFLITWSWQREWDTKFSVLNNNLVFRWFHKGTNKPIYSFLGNNDVTQTCESLFSFIKEKDKDEAGLSYIPEISLKGLDFTKYYLEIDINSSDYIFELSAICNLAGNKYSQKRGRLHYFKSHYPDVTLKIIDPRETNVKNEIYNLNKLWSSKKMLDEETIDGDLDAIARLLEIADENVSCIGIYDNKVETKLVGYAIYSFPNSDYIINHFIKADVSYKGIYEFIMSECARIYIAEGFKYLNHLEDLGIEGLRRAKMSYRPEHFLRKYHIKKL